jgi:ATP-dependent Clp protease ATP-binding subunit ClpA
LRLEERTLFQTQKAVGLRALMESRSKDVETISSRVIQAAQRELRPELFGRFDLVCAFNKLDGDTLNAVAELHLNRFVDAINAQGHRIRCSPGVLGHVQAEGYSMHYGVRPMRSAVRRIVRDVVTGRMIENGGRPVCGVIEYDPKSNRCFLES